MDEQGSVEGSWWSRAGQGEKALELQRRGAQSCEGSGSGQPGPHRGSIGRSLGEAEANPGFLLPRAPHTCTDKKKWQSRATKTVAHLNIYVLQEDLINHILAKH